MKLLENAFLFPPNRYFTPFFVITHQPEDGEALRRYLESQQKSFSTQFSFMSVAKISDFPFTLTPGNMRKRIPTLGSSHEHTTYYLFTFNF